MIIQCTKKLIDELGITPSESLDTDDLFAWHANFSVINRRKAVILQNDKNHFVVVLYGLKAKDFKNFNNVFKQALSDAFLTEGIDEEVIKKYLQETNIITYTKTKNRSRVSYLSKITSVIKNYYDKYLDKDILFQSEVSRRANRYIVRKDGKYLLPIELLIEDLKSKYGKAISVIALKFRITLSLEDKEVWRDIVVPSTKNLKELHELIQAAFTWKGYHLHEFFVYSKDKYEENLSFNHSGYHPEGYKVILNFKGQDEEIFFDEDYEIYLEDGVYLFQITTSRMKYVYDYGDFWEHYIDLIDIIEGYDKHYAELVDYHGDAPPEDVGGARGFADFLEIINDKNHEEREDFLKWGEHQWYKKDFISYFEKQAKFN